MRIAKRTNKLSKTQKELINLIEIKMKELGHTEGTNDEKLDNLQKIFGLDIAREIIENYKEEETHEL
jgi:hypothetical protein